MKQFLEFIKDFGGIALPIIVCSMALSGAFYLCIGKNDNREQITTCTEICGGNEKLIECNAKDDNGSLKIVCFTPETNVQRTVTIKR